MQDNEALQWLESYHQYGWKFGLDRIYNLVDQLGNPQKDMKCIHVAGTNGKGSVCRFLSSILIHAGYKVGAYFSPHLERFSERILVDGKEISQDDLASLVERIKPVVEEMQRQNKTPTFFEIVTALAFCYFHEQHVDYVVLEVGLGGRYDATNVVIPLVSVITNITLEHTNILGNSVESIAFEKAGIIKNNIPVITAAGIKPREVIETVSKEKNAPLMVVNRTKWKRLSYTLNCQEFFIQGAFKDYAVKTSMLGEYQGENIALAIATIEQLQMQGVYLSDTDVIEGISSTVHTGRMEIMSEHPLIVLEGAHNPDGINMLRQTLQNDFTYDHLILVLGILKDKDIDTMIQSVVPLAEIIIITRSGNPRACDPESIKEKIEKKGFSKNLYIKYSVPEAIEHAQLLAKDNDLICITGSLFTVGEARTYLLKKKQLTV
jgi:dihydrofolate synthase / folylpolyglutamate synthase